MNEILNNHSITRRDFLKLAAAGAALPAAAISSNKDFPVKGLDAEQPNILVVLFDALSAFNLSIFGYQRQTCPNLEGIVNSCTVYHNHHAAGNYTTPSTASLLTSTYPWTHRVFNLNGLIAPENVPNNIFSTLSEKFYTAAFTQNIHADSLLAQCGDSIDLHQDLDSFAVSGNVIYNSLFEKDAIMAFNSYDGFLFKRVEAHGSLFLSILRDLFMNVHAGLTTEQMRAAYPHGLPRIADTDVYFTFEEVMNGVIGMVNSYPEPFFSYIHLLPPHEPYVPSGQFLGTISDEWHPEPKPRHPLSTRVKEKRNNEHRQIYDEFIKNVDWEFGRLVNYLKETGLWDNTYVIFTSDHGELFERGVHGHSTPVVFEPVLKVPFFVHAPGQEERIDVHALTSNIDLLPTFAHLAGLPVPDFSEGQVLPGLGGSEDPQRTVFTVEAKRNGAYEPLEKVSVAMLRDRYKLAYFLGYKNYDDEYDFYDLNLDPEELNNYKLEHPTAVTMKEELQEILKEVNEPYL
jgi:arylsulfatase A-like enzyme